MKDSDRISQLERQLTQYESSIGAADIGKKIDALNELAWLLVDIDLNRAYALSETVYALSNLSEDGKPQYQAGMAYSLRTQGYLNQRLGKYDLGLSQLFRAQEIVERLEIDDALPDILDGIAGIYGQISDFPEALNYMFKQLNAAQQLGDKRLIANAYNNLANIYIETGDYKRGIDTLLENLKIAAEADYKRIECLSYLNLAETYLRTGNYADALEYGLRGLPVSQEAGFKLFEVYAYDILGKTHMKLGKTEQALLYFKKALALSTKIDSKVTESLILLDMGEAFQEMGRLDLARDYFQKSLTIAQAIDGKAELFKANLHLSEIYEKLGDFAQALFHFKQYQSIKEAVFSEKADQRLKVLQVAHDTEAARNEAEFFHQKNLQLEQEITERTRVESKLQRQLALIRAVSECSQTLMAGIEIESDIRPLLEKSLRPLLKPTGASAVFITKNFLDAELGPCLYELVEVCAPGVEPSFTGDRARMHIQALLRPYIQDVKNVGVPSQSVFTPWSIFPAEVHARLSTGEPIGGPVRDLFAESPDLVDIYLGEHIFSIQFFPLHVSGQFWGIIGLDDRSDERTWTEDEILLLGTAAEAVESTLRRWQAEDDLRTANDRLELDVHDRTIELSDTIVALHKEIAERERAEAEIQKMVETLEQRVAARTEELVTFFDLILLAGQATTPNDVIEQALPRILEVTRSQAICVHLYDVDHNNLVLSAQQNLYDEAQAQLQTVELQSDFQRWMQQPQDPILSRDQSQLAILPAGFHPPESLIYLGMQIRIGKQIQGLLSCYREKDYGYGLDDIALIMALAEQIGLMLENHRLRQNAEEIAVLEERQRLARDLHDSVTQSLYSLSLFSRVGREAAEDGDHDRLIYSLTELERNTLHALREMRLLLYELRPADLEQGGVIPAIEMRLNTVERRLGLQVDVQMDDYEGMSPAREIQLYHIIVEALNNVVKHAAATHLTLQLTQVDGYLRLRIIDNGQGFDPAQTKRGMGLGNIRERVAWLDGQLSISSQPGSGTQLEILIPCQEEESQ